MVSRPLSTAALHIVPGLQSTKLDSGLQLQSKKYHMCLTDSISHISEGYCPFCNVYTVSSTYGVWPRLIQISPLSCTAWPFISPHILWHSSFIQVQNFSSLTWPLFSRPLLHFLEGRQNSNSILCSTYLPTSTVSPGHSINTIPSPTTWMKELSNMRARADPWRIPLGSQGFTATLVTASLALGLPASSVHAAGGSAKGFNAAQGVDFLSRSGNNHC